MHFSGSSPGGRLLAVHEPPGHEPSGDGECTSAAAAPGVGCLRFIQPPGHDPWNVLQRQQPRGWVACGSCSPPAMTHQGKGNVTFRMYFSGSSPECTSAAPNVLQRQQPRGGLLAVHATPGHEPSGDGERTSAAAALGVGCLKLLRPSLRWPVSMHEPRVMV